MFINTATAKNDNHRVLVKLAYLAKSNGPAWETAVSTISQSIAVASNKHRVVTASSNSTSKMCANVR